MIHPLLFLLFAASIAFGQKPASVTEKLIYEFDPARPIEHLEATPDGSLWFAVDAFNLKRNIIISGERIERDFNEIPIVSAQMDPSGSYIIWMGLVRSFDVDGFNTSTTEVYKAYRANGKVRNDSAGFFTADYNTLAFSRDGAHWAALLPRANVKQQGLRDVVILDGKIIAADNPMPRMFSFGSTSDTWAYRSTEDTKENLVTKEGIKLLIQHRSKNPYSQNDEPVIRFFSPENIAFGGIAEGFDYDNHFPHVAALYKTSYRSAHRDSARSYLIFRNKVQRPLRWINNITFDTAGEHIAYLGADPAWEPRTNERRGVVVLDGNVIAGPYDATSLLFMSPSGKHLAWSAKEGEAMKLFYDKKFVANIGAGLRVVWSKDEKRYAYITTNERGKSVVHTGAKVSEPFDRTGRIGFSDDDKTLEFAGLRANKLYQVKIKL